MAMGYRRTLKNLQIFSFAYTCLSIFITSIYVDVLIFNMKSLAWQQSALSISEQKILFSCKSSKQGTQSRVDAE